MIPGFEVCVFIHLMYLWTLHPGKPANMHYLWFSCFVFGIYC